MSEPLPQPRQSPLHGLVVLRPRSEGGRRPRARPPSGPAFDCRRFVDGYSDYRDGRLDPAARIAAQAHMTSCDACRRYDRVIRSGVSALREEGAPAPPRRAAVARIRSRAWAMDMREAMALGPAGSGVSTLGLALVVVVLASFAWLPLFGAGTSAASAPEFEMPPVVAAVPTAPAPVPPTIGVRPSEVADDGVRPSAPLPAASRRAPPNARGLAAGVDPD